MRVGEVSARRQRSCAREQDLDAIPWGGVVGEQSEGDREPVGRAFWGTVGGCISGVAQCCNGSCIPLPSGPLDVMGALFRADTTGCEDVGTPLVGA